MPRTSPSFRSSNQLNLCFVPKSERQFALPGALSLVFSTRGSDAFGLAFDDNRKLRLRKSSFDAT